MLRLEKLFLPVDFSKRSTSAVHYANPLAHKFQSEVIMLHALSHPSLEFNAESFGAMLTDRSGFAEDELDAFSAAEFDGLQTRKLVVPGDPAIAIADFTRHEKVDLIVMPTHGYGPFRRFILGSTTAKVLHDVECPVLTGTHLDEIPAHGSIRYDNIVCAVDLGPNSLGALRWAAGLAEVFESRLFLVHAIPSLPEAEGDYYNSGTISPLPVAALRTMVALQQEACTHAVPIVVGGDIVKAVGRQTRELSADLLVIGRSTSGALLGRLRTHAYALIRESPCPVVSI